MRAEEAPKFRIMLKRKCFLHWLLMIMWSALLRWLDLCTSTSNQSTVKFQSFDHLHDQWTKWSWSNCEIHRVKCIPSLILKTWLVIALTEWLRWLLNKIISNVILVRLTNIWPINPFVCVWTITSPSSEHDVLFLNKFQISTLY